MSKAPQKTHHVSYRRNAARFISLLMRGQHSLAELAEKTPMDYERVRCFIHDLKAHGVVHVSAWRRDSRNRASIALYSLGFNLDAPKPSAMTALQRTRKHEAKQEKPLTKAPKRVRAPSSVFDLGAMQ